MPSRRTTRFLTAVRLGVVVAGLLVAGWTVLRLLSMPPPPPDSDGFAHGMAGLIGGLLVLVSLGVAAVAVILPSLLDRTDPLGFDRRQRQLLRAAGVLLVGGLLVALAWGLVSGLLAGVMLWFVLVVVAALVVVLTLLWRVTEVVLHLVRGRYGGRPS